VPTRPVRPHFADFSTSFARSEVKKPEIKSIAALRQAIPGTSMLKAREALLATRSAEAPDTDNVPAALEWLEDDRRKSGASKSEKVAGRTAAEGLVGVCVLADGLVDGRSDTSGATGGGASPIPQAAIVEVNCETDFVARSELFVQLVRDITHTATLFPVLAGLEQTVSPSNAGPALVELPIQDLLQFPLLSSSADAETADSVKTISAAIVDTVARLGEKISLSRASALVSPGTTPASAPRRSESGTAAGSETANLASAYAHGGPTTSAATSSHAPGYLLTSGRVASLVLTRISSSALPHQLASEPSIADSASPSLQIATRALTRSLARQVAGMDTRSIEPGAEDVVSLEGPPSTALYAQPFAMLLSAAAPSHESVGQSVRDVLRAWSAQKGLGDAAVQVQQFQRWEVGENVQREETGPDFAEEVRKVAGL